MRQAIVTKFLGPTNYRGARVRATAQAGSILVNWDHALDVDANHLNAARALMTKYNWEGELFGGGLPDGTGNAYVMTLCDRDPATIAEGRSQIETRPA